MPRARWKLLRTIALVIVALVVHRLWRVGPGCAALGLGGAPDGPDTANDELAVLSWNLHNFPGDHDRDRIRARIDAVAPHVLAVQEVRDATALAELLPEHRVLLSEHGGARGQALGVAIDRRVELVGDLVEHRAVAMGGRVRPAVSVYLRIGALDLHVVVVHLKAMPEGHALRRMQWATLADVIARLPLSGPGAGDRDVLLVGDFNATGPEGGDPADELAALTTVLGELGLRPLAIDGGCSAYWDGLRRDAWLEPSLLDLAFVGGLDDDAAAWVATPLGACARAACTPVRSTQAYPDPQIVGMSDHCGVLVELRGD